MKENTSVWLDEGSVSETKCFFTPTRVASEFIYNPLFHPSVEWAHCLFIQTYRQTGAIIGAKEPKHILVLQLNNNLLPNLFFWENRSLRLFFFYSELVSIDAVQHAEHCTFTWEDFPQPNLCKPLNAAFCSTVFLMFCHLVAYVKQSHQNYQHIRVLPEINFRATRQLLWEKKQVYTFYGPCG